MRTVKVAGTSSVHAGPTRMTTRLVVPTTANVFVYAARTTASVDG